MVQGEYYDVYKHVGGNDMIDKRTLIVLVLVFALVVAGFAGFLPLDLFGDADTDTVAYTAYTNSNTPTYGVDDEEFCDETHIVTSWKHDANSVKLTFQGNMYINECSWAGTRSETPMYYYYVVSMDTGNGWSPILWADDYNRDIIHLTTPTSGHPGKPFEFAEGDYDDILYKVGGGKYPVYDQNGDVLYTTHRGCGLFCDKIYPNLQTVGIELLGPYVGKLKVELYGLFDVEWNNPGLYSRLLLKDEVNLLSGAGSIDIDTSTSIFEEGETVPLLVDTGFSGNAMGSGDGWELRIYEPGSDTSKNGQAYETFGIADDVANYRIDFTVPNDAYNPSGSNMWTVKLWNTLFDQAEEEFFTVGEGMSDQGPTDVTVSFDKPSYEKGDTVTVTVSASPNPAGRNKVYEFYVKAYYGNSEINSVSSDLPKYIPAVANKAEFSFIANRADAYVTVEARAFDADHGEGGLPSEVREVTVYLKDADPTPDIPVVNVDLADVIVIILTVGIFAVMAIFVPVHVALKVLLFIIGVILAFVYWAYASGALMSWMG